jgi:1,4-dihydroxy-2-naphthoyl-CoA hydrolase
MPFIYHRTIRFQDTDAAGVIYFANTLAMCHEAYEESLMASGIQVWKFCSDREIALPIVRATVDYFRPAFCGDRHEIRLSPALLSETKFEIRYEIREMGDPEHLVSQALTHHVCISSVNRQRQSLPQAVLDWLTQWSQPDI